MAPDEPSPKKLMKLISSARKDFESLDFASAAELFTNALDQPAISDEQQFEALSMRAECYRRLANFSREADDLRELASLAEVQGALKIQAQAIDRLALSLLFKADYPGSEKIVNSLFELVKKVQDPAEKSELEVMAAFRYGQVLRTSHRYEESLVQLGKALHLAKQQGDDERKARSHWELGLAYWRMGRRDEARLELETSLEIFRRLGDVEGEADASLGLASVIQSPEKVRQFAEKALGLYRSIGLLERQHVVFNNLMVFYMGTANYNRALDYAEQALHLHRNLETATTHGFLLGNLVELYFQLGNSERSLEFAKESEDQILFFKDSLVQQNFGLNLGMALLSAGLFDEALATIQTSSLLAAETALPSEAAQLSWQAAAWLAKGQLEPALQCTSKAVEIFKKRGNAQVASDAETWWWRYRALVECRDPDELLDIEAWEALDNARKEMLIPLSEPHDAGLSRSYLGKTRSHRLLIPEWLHQAKRRGGSLEPLTNQLKTQTDISLQLERLLDVGVRMNASGEVEKLPGLIMDEILELTGAERAALMLIDADGERRPAAVHLPVPSLPVMLAPGQTDPGLIDEQSFLKEITPFLDQTARKRSGSLTFYPTNAVELEQRSALCIPMLFQNQLVGLVYADISGMYGRFNSIELRPADSARKSGCRRL